MEALTLDRAAVSVYGSSYTWAAATRQFLGNLHPATRASALVAA
jgi:hypothetical protein